MKSALIFILGLWALEPAFAPPPAPPSFIRLFRVSGDHTYVVVHHTERNERSTIFRLRDNRDLDPAFGNGGLFRIDGWDGWQHSVVRDLQIGPDGDIYLLGDVFSEGEPVSDFLSRTGRSLPLGDSLIFNANALFDIFEAEFDADRSSTKKLFVARLSPNGVLREFYGDHGVAYVHHAVSSEGDVVGRLKVFADHSVLFTASRQYEAERYQLLLGRLDGAGHLDETLAPDDHGIVAVPRSLHPHPEIDTLEVYDIGGNDREFRIIGESRDDLFSLRGLWSKARRKPILQAAEPLPSKADADGELLDNLAAIDPNLPTAFVTYAEYREAPHQILKIDLETGNTLAELKVAEHPLLADLDLRSMQVLPDGRMLLLGRQASERQNALSLVADPELRSLRVHQKFIGFLHRSGFTCAQRIANRIR